MNGCKQKYLLIAYVLFHCGFSFNAQNPNKILNTVYTKLSRAKDYSVDVNIKVDLPFIKMLPINAKIYFKQKDKFKVLSKGIAIVPRQGFEQIGKLIGDSSSYTANFQSSELINGLKISLYTIIPLSDTADVVLGKLWIDEKNAVIVKSHVTTRSNGTIVTEYTYGKQLVYGLPDFMQFEIDIKKFKVPKAVAADINSSQKKSNEKGSRKGKITIKLDNYQINKGISDSIFKK